MCKLCHHVAYQDGLKILFAADSCNVTPKLYERIHKVMGDIDMIISHPKIITKQQAEESDLLMQFVNKLENDKFIIDSF